MAGPAGPANVIAAGGEFAGRGIEGFVQTRTIGRVTVRAIGLGGMPGQVASALAISRSLWPVSSASTW